MEDVTEWRTDAKNSDLADALGRMDDANKGRITDKLAVQFKFSDDSVRTIGSLKEFHGCIRDRSPRPVVWRLKFD